MTRGRLVTGLARGAVRLLVLLAAPIVARADATFTLVNTDPPGVGYNDPTPVSPVGGNPGTTLGEQRLNALRYAAEIWGGLLDSSVDIRVVVLTLAGCNFGYTSVNSFARDFTGAPVPNTWYAIALANKLAGMDLCPPGGSCSSSDDITVALPRDCGYHTEFQLVPGVRGWVSLMLHELGHGLGFTTPMNTATGQRLMGIDDIYIRHLEDHDTGKLYPAMTDAERAAADTKTGRLHWIGPNVVAASGTLSQGVGEDGHVEMHAPPTLQFGVSVHHFSSALLPEQLMGGGAVPETHDVGLALELMRDLGWFIEGLTPFECYSARDLEEPEFAPVSVSQSDQFGTRTATVRRPEMLCSPATIGGGAPTASSAGHLVCYRVTDVGETSPTKASVTDRFGTLTLKVKKAKLLCVPAVVTELP